MVVLDTSVIIDHLRQNPTVKSLLFEINRKEGKDCLCISVITLQELYEGKSTRSERKLDEMLSVMAPLRILEYNQDIAEIAGTIARDSKITIEFADAAIAATCIFNNFELLTLNESILEVLQIWLCILLTKKTC